MKIVIQSGKFRLRLIVGQRFALWFLKKKTSGSEIPAELWKTLRRELKKAKKTFGKLSLVDIQSSNGDLVKITL